MGEVVSERTATKACILVSLTLGGVVELVAFLSFGSDSSRQTMGL